MQNGTEQRLHFDQFCNIINGESRSSKTFHHGINPASSDRLWPVPIGNQEDVNEAVGACNYFTICVKAPLD